MVSKFSKTSIVILLLALIFSLISISQSIAGKKSQPTSSKKIIINNDSINKNKNNKVNNKDNQYSNHHLIAEKIINNNISEAQFKELKLTYDEFIEVVKEVAALKGADKKHMDNFANTHNKKLKKNYNAMLTDDPDDLETIIKYSPCKKKKSWGDCTQDVEMKKGKKGKTFSSSHKIDASCDNDSEDDEWRFDFYPDWAVNPNKIRWYATHFWVRWVFYLVYHGGDLTGSSLCTCPISLCIGDRGVAAAGGADFVAKHLYIWHKK